MLKNLNMNQRVWFLFLFGNICLTAFFPMVLMQENMTRMLMVSDVHDSIKRHQAQIITSLKDPDIRLKALWPFLITSHFLSSSVAIDNRQMYLRHRYYTCIIFPYPYVSHLFVTPFAFCIWKSIIVIADLLPPLCNSISLIS